MSSKSTATTSFRISHYEAMLIRRGLAWLIGKQQLWEKNGCPLDEYVSWPGYRPRINQGKFSPECQAVIFQLALGTINNFQAQSRRLHLDAVELAACILGVRITGMLARHGHIKLPPPICPVRSRHLLTKLERLRKQAKRAYIRAQGQKAFTEASYRWQQHVRFARGYFLYCMCNRTVLPDPSGKRLHRLIQDQWIDRFRRELPDRGLEIPPEAELRQLVKRAIRLGRRLIHQWGRITTHRKQDVLHERMVNYVARRCRKPKAPAA